MEYDATYIIISVISITAVILLSLYLYSLKKKDKDAEDNRDLKALVSKIQSKRESLKDRIDDQRAQTQEKERKFELELFKIRETLDEVRLNLEHVTSEMQERTVDIEDLSSSLDKVIEKLEVLREDLRTVSYQASEARRYSHDHLFGGRPR